jgi:hypothetical protein
LKIRTWWGYSYAIELDVDGRTLAAIDRRTDGAAPDRQRQMFAASSSTPTRELVARFGEAPEPALRRLVAMAHKSRTGAERAGS